MTASQPQPKLMAAFRGAVDWWLSQTLATRFRLCFGIFALILILSMAVSPKPWAVGLEAMERPSVADYVKVFSWWGSLINLCILAVLAATAGWWAVPAKADPPVGRGWRLPRWFWLGLGGAVVFLGLTGIPRMNLSFNHDERYSVRRAIMGHYRVSDAGEIQLRQTNLRDTLYYYVKPNNHILHSLLAKTSWSIWRLFPGSRGPDFQEWVIRLPAFLFGLAGLVTLGWLLARNLSPGVGLTAAWLMAIHPWYLRYVTEARGYSMAIALIPLVLIFWQQALDRKLWRWWFAFAAGQFALIYSYPATIYVLVVLNLLTLGCLLFSGVRKDGDWSQVFRWFGANSLAGLAAVQLMLPLIPQFLRYMETGEARGGMDLSWLQNSGAFFLSGVSWNKSLTEGLPYLELQNLAASSPLLFQLCLWGGALLALIGLVPFLRAPGQVRIVGAVLVLPAVLGALLAKLGNQHMFEWYSIHLLPGLAALVAAGIWLVGRKVSEWTHWRLAWPLLTVASLSLYFVFSHPSRLWLMANPIEASKDSVLLARGTNNPYQPGQDNILTGSFRLIPDLYDPRCVDLRSTDQLLDLMRQADAEGKPLYIVVGNLWSAAFGASRSWRLFHESGMFDDFVIMRSFEPSGDHAVARYVPGALEKFDLEGFLASPDYIPNADAPPATYSKTLGAPAP